MKSFRPWLGALAALVFCNTLQAMDFATRLKIEAARPVAPHLPRTGFLQRTAIEQAAISPDGGRVAFLRSKGSDKGVWLMDTTSGAEHPLLARSDARRLAWTRNGEWLLLVSPGKVFALAAGRERGARVVIELGGPQKREFIDIDPSTSTSIVVRERLPDAMGRPVAWRLSRVGIDGRVDVLDTDTDRIEGYAFAGTGVLAYVQHLRGKSLVTTRIDASGARSDVMRCQVMRRCELWPLLDSSGDLFFVADENDLPTRLYRMKNGERDVIAGDPGRLADIAAISADPASGLPWLLSFRGPVAMIRGLDDRARQRLADLEHRLPGRALAIDAGRSHWLIVEQGGDMQGRRYYLLDTASNYLLPVLEELPLRARDDVAGRWLPSDALASQLPFEWTASDGMRLHGFVRVPPGRDARNLPMVVLVHGGPWASVAPDDFGSGVAAFLANRGYVVFEPNYRGSVGYGTNYMLAPHGDFGNGRVQKDIVEGVQALLAQDVGDRDRIAIAGASFGGYSALLGLTWQGDMFRAGIAIVPPTDFAWDIEWVRRSREANVLSSKLPYEDWMSAVSLDPSNTSTMAHLHAQSPLSNTDRMMRPVLIVAGDNDQRVALRGVLGYVAKLRLRGHLVSLLVDPAAGHADDLPLARETTFHVMAAMLHRYLGGDADDPADIPMEDYVRRNGRSDTAGVFLLPVPDAHP